MTLVSNRNSTIDTARGIVILLVVFQHCGAFEQFLLSFHMPLFFIISGILVKEIPPNNTFLEELKVNAKRLLVPQLMLGLIHCLYLEKLSIHWLSMAELVDSVFKWWFLLVLFQCKLLMWLFRKYLLNSRMAQMIFVLILVVCTALIQCHPGHFYGTYMEPELIPVSMLFMLFGFYFKRFLLPEGQKPMGGVITLLLLLATIIVAYTNDKVWMYKVEFGNVVLFLLSGVLGSVAVIRIAACVKSGFLQWLGIMSMPVYVLQFHINVCCRNIVEAARGLLQIESQEICVALVICLSLASCIILTMLISKCKVTSFLFGIKNKVSFNEI